MNAESDCRIRRLPVFVANQIAAGEVVQRPESVVKELVENAIDAGASHVTVIVSGAGKSLIQVTDDGEGMSHQDALLAFERHATSKIGEASDLERIITLGFRGEALPSIASIAKVELRTRTASAEMASLVRIEGGNLEEHTFTAGDTGTSVSVRNLFFNTPARMQFLKSDSTEFRLIADTVQRYILSYPELRITLIADGNRIYDVPPGVPAGRLSAVLGERAASALLEVREETDLITVSGYIGRPDFARKTRGEQYLFVNGRFVVNRLINHAVVSAYENMVQQGEFPAYVLFLNINPKEVDVNVHPSKLEVKFSNERHIYTMINAVVRRSLYGSDISPAMGFRRKPTPEVPARGPSPAQYGSRAERPVPAAPWTPRTSTIFFSPSV